MPDPQRCIASPGLPAFSLPAGLSFKVPTISISFNPKFCCKLPGGSIATPAVPIPAVIFAPLSAVMKQLNALLSQAKAAIPIRCPRL